MRSPCKRKVPSSILGVGNQIRIALNSLLFVLWAQNLCAGRPTDDAGECFYVDICALGMYQPASLLCSLVGIQSLSVCAWRGTCVGCEFTEWRGGKCWCEEART